MTIRRNGPPADGASSGRTRRAAAPAAPVVLGTVAVLAGLFLALPAGAQLEGPSWAECRARGSCTLPIISYPRAPFAFFDAKNRWTGFEVQMMDLFERHLEDQGVEIELEWHRKDSFSGVLEGVRASTGGVFAVSQLSPLEERRAAMAFSPSYMSNVMILVTHADVPALESLDGIGDAFAGLKALTIGGTTLEAALRELAKQQMPGLQIEVVASDGVAVTRIINEPGCCFAYLDYPQFGSAVRQGARLRRHAVGDRAGDSFAVAFPRGTDWQPLVDAFFAEFVGSPDAEFLLEHFMGWEQASTLRPAEHP